MARGGGSGAVAANFGSSGMVVSQPSTVYPSRSPAGLGAATVCVHKLPEIASHFSDALGDFAFAYARLGRRSEALEIVRRLESRVTECVSLYWPLALAYPGLGDETAAVEALRSAAAPGSAFYSPRSSRKRRKALAPNGLEP